MAFAAFKRRVQQSDVEITRDRRRIVRREVSILGLAGISLSVHGDPQSVEANRARLIDRKNVDVFG